MNERLLLLQGGSECMGVPRGPARRAGLSRPGAEPFQRHRTIPY